MGVWVVFFDAICKMVRDSMMITRGVSYDTLDKLDACVVEFNSNSMKINSMEEVRVSFVENSHGIWVPKSALSSK